MDIARFIESQPEELQSFFNNQENIPEPEIRRLIQESLLINELKRQSKPL